MIQGCAGDFYCSGAARPGPASFLVSVLPAIDLSFDSQGNRTLGLPQQDCGIDGSADAQVTVVL